MLKGICHPDDVRRADRRRRRRRSSCSTHGGRQANGGLAAIDCLPDVVEAAGPTSRCCSTPACASGTDVVKALALGATAVGIGRPYAYAAALGGTDGIVHVLARCSPRPTC